MTDDEKALAGVDWKPVLPNRRGGALPYVTHTGVLKIGDDELRCYTLNDGRRIFDAADVERLLGLSSQHK